jgi:hypothetical protein
VRDRGGPADRRRKQRQALSLLATTIFAADGFRFSPAFLSRLAISDFDIDDARGLGRTVPTVDVAVDQKVLSCSAPYSTSCSAKPSRSGW